MSQDCSDVFDIYTNNCKKAVNIPKRRGITFRILKKTEWEKLLKVTWYTIYPADFESALAELRAAESRGEVTDIETED